MQDNAQQALEVQKYQLIHGLSGVAETLRNTASIAENFAQFLQQTPFVPQTQAPPPGTGAAPPNFPLGMFPMFGQLFGGALGGLAGANGHAQPQAVLSPTADTPSKSETVPEAEDGKKRKRGQGAEKEEKKRGRKPKDPNAPKRPPSTYIVFQNEVRKAMQEKYPNLAYSEILGKISERWAALSPEQKAIYDTITKAAKEQYDLKKKAYEEAINSGLSGEEAHKFAEQKYLDPVIPEPAAPVKLTKPAEESDEESSEEASPVDPAAQSDSDDSSVEQQIKSKSKGDSSDSDSSSDEEDSEDDEEEPPKPPPSKKQKVQEKAKPASNAVSTPQSVVKNKPASKDKDKENKKKEKEGKKKEKKSKKESD